MNHTSRRFLSHPQRATRFLGLELEQAFIHVLFVAVALLGAAHGFIHRSQENLFTRQKKVMQFSNWQVRNPWEVKWFIGTGCGKRWDLYLGACRMTRIRTLTLYLYYSVVIVHWNPKVTFCLPGNITWRNIFYNFNFNLCHILTYNSILSEAVVSYKRAKLRMLT